MSSFKKNGKHPGYKRWVFVFLVLGILVHAGVFYIFSLDLDDPPERSPQEGFIYFQAGELPLVEDELEQRALLFDSEPLFLPTSRNFSGPIKTDASIWEPEVTISRAFEPDIRWSDSLLRLDPVVDENSGSPFELLHVVSRDFVSEFGAQAMETNLAPEPGLYVEAWDSQGNPVLQTFVNFEEKVDLEFPLNPAEFSILYDHFGLAGEPLLISPSGNEETDNFARRFILQRVNPLLLGANGYFRVKIGL